jgi:hypothetical protein
MANGHKIYQLFPMYGPPKYTEIGIFGLKIYHLANLNSEDRKLANLFRNLVQRVRIYLPVCLLKNTATL